MRRLIRAIAARMHKSNGVDEVSDQHLDLTGYTSIYVFLGGFCTCVISNKVSPKSRIVQKHTYFAPERYTAGILYTDSLNSA